MHTTLRFFNKILPAFLVLYFIVTMILFLADFWDSYQEQRLLRRWLEGKEQPDFVFKIGFDVNGCSFQHYLKPHAEPLPVDSASLNQEKNVTGSIPLSGKIGVEMQTGFPWELNFRYVALTPWYQPTVLYDDHIDLTIPSHNQAWFGYDDVIPYTHRIYYDKMIPSQSKWDLEPLVNFLRFAEKVQSDLPISEMEESEVNDER